MRFNRILTAVLALALTAPVVAPAFAGGPTKAPVSTSTNVGVLGGCQTYIVCISPTDPYNSQACNNGRARVITQCARKH